MAELESVYENKGAGYFQNPREDLVKLVKGTDLVVLDVGCGAGATGKRLLETGQAKWVTGIELVPSQATVAQQSLNQVLVGDISQMEFNWTSGYFDCIIAGDVLEHLVDPYSVLKKLEPMLRADGLLIASIPNVRHWWVIRDLVLRGEWRYELAGVMDETHLRFFTRRSAGRLLHDSGFVTISVQPFFWGPKTRMFDRLTLGMFEEFLSLRWLIQARPRRPRESATYNDKPL